MLTDFEVRLIQEKAERLQALVDLQNEELGALRHSFKTTQQTRNYLQGRVDDLVQRVAALEEEKADLKKRADAISGWIPGDGIRGLQIREAAMEKRIRELCETIHEMREAWLTVGTYADGSGWIAYPRIVASSTNHPADVAVALYRERLRTKVMKQVEELERGQKESGEVGSDTLSVSQAS